MRTADKLEAHHSILRVKNIGIDLFERISSVISVAVAGGSCKHIFCHFMLLKCGEYLLSIMLGNLVDPGEYRCDVCLRTVAQRQDFFIQSK